MAVRRNQFLPVKGINQLDWSILSEGSLVDHLLVQIFFHTVWSSADWVHPAARAFSAKKKTDQIKSTQKNKNNLLGPNAHILMTNILCGDGKLILVQYQIETIPKRLDLWYISGFSHWIQ